MPENTTRLVVGSNMLRSPAGIRYVSDEIKAAGHALIERDPNDPQRVVITTFTDLPGPPQN